MSDIRRKMKKTKEEDVMWLLLGVRKKKKNIEGAALQQW